MPFISCDIAALLASSFCLSSFESSVDANLLTPVLAYWLPFVCPLVLSHLLVSLYRETNWTQRHAAYYLHAQTEILTYGLNITLKNKPECIFPNWRCMQWVMEMTFLWRTVSLVTVSKLNIGLNATCMTVPFTVTQSLDELDSPSGSCSFISSARANMKEWWRPTFW